MRVAIVHDWLVTPGGAENVLAELLRMFPCAELYSVIDFFPEQARAELLGGKKAHVTGIQKLPMARRLYPFYLPFMPLAVARIDLSAYDLVISSSHAVAKGVLTHPHQRHVCYCHTPMRYAWDRQFEYLGNLPSIPGLKTLAAWQLQRLRLWDQSTVSGVDCLIANSAFVARRIELAYRRKAQVIYPPVDVAAWRPLTFNKNSYYVTHGRLVAYKHIHTIVEAFTCHLPDRQLVVIGAGPMARRIERIAGPNVELVGRLPREMLIKRIQRARAYVYAAVEDFGIAPIEALAAGTPVIAYGRGAVRETVGTDPTLGLLYNDRSAEGVATAIRRFEQQEAVFDPHQCVAHAEKFSVKRFEQQLHTAINEELLKLRV